MCFVILNIHIATEDDFQMMTLKENVYKYGTKDTVFAVQMDLPFDFI